MPCTSFMVMISDWMIKLFQCNFSKFLNINSLLTLERQFACGIFDFDWSVPSITKDKYCSGSSSAFNQLAQYALRSALKEKTLALV